MKIGMYHVSACLLVSDHVVYLWVTMLFTCEWPCCLLVSDHVVYFVSDHVVYLWVTMLFTCEWQCCLLVSDNAVYLWVTMLFTCEWQCCLLVVRLIQLSREPAYVCQRNILSYDTFWAITFRRIVFEFKKC